jgi:hypothetical protein
MNVYDGKHWNIYEILPYQRNFNLINGVRSIGKTYTAQMYVLDKCIEKGYEFVYVVRTQDQKKHGILEDAFKKVTVNEFKEFIFDYDIENMYMPDSGKILGYCIALSETIKVKLRSFPKVKYLIFDEYMLEEKQSLNYVNGWKEPDLLLNLYHTIDREEDRVICFLLGNNTKFHNPYHLHPAFNIPPVKPGNIWTSENVLFQYAVESEGLEKQKSKSKFLRMLENTEYGTYAKDGEYVGDNYNFIEKIEETAHYDMTLEYNKKSFGVYSDPRKGLIYISDKVDPSCRLSYALTIEDHKENTMLTHSRQYTQLRWLSDNYKRGNVRFVSMIVKAFIEPGVAMIL